MSPRTAAVCRGIFYLRFPVDMSLCSAYKYLCWWLTAIRGGIVASIFSSLFSFPLPLNRLFIRIYKPAGRVIPALSSCQGGELKKFGSYGLVAPLTEGSSLFFLIHLTFGFFFRSSFRSWICLRSNAKNDILCAVKKIISYPRSIECRGFLFAVFLLFIFLCWQWSLFAI